MIKFIRKIRQNLLSDGKTGKYFKYAIGEIILVVIGILVALQINNWNEWRKDRVQERILMTQLHVEFVKNKEQLEITSKGHQRGLDYCVKMIDLFPMDLKTVNLDSIQNFLYDNAILNEWTFNPSNATVNALSSNGTFAIIENDELRNRLMAWTATLDDYLEDQERAMNYLIEEVGPYIDDHVSQGPLGITDPRLSIDFLTTPEFENIIYKREYYFKTLLSQEDTFPEFSNLCKAIDEILELTAPR